jgi:glyceraldehyde-3-phosphate dehydrogenase (NAD(P))
MDKKTILVIGTGTIGEPLITLLSRLKSDLGIDEVYFHKHTPLLSDKTKVVHLLSLGAKLCVSSRKKQEEFEAIGLHPECNINEALNKATVVIDCTPSGVGVNNKDEFYGMYTHNTRGFIAQGSESGFGKPYAYNINDEAITKDDQFLQVVSCNTHNMACILKALAFEDGESILERANFVCMRRASDISQTDDFVASPTCDSHKDKVFGTHHARDVYDLFRTLDCELNLFSSAIKLPTQYMHVLHFNLQLSKEVSQSQVLQKIQNSKLIATTEKKDTGTTFSFARDHSAICGRVLNQAIIPVSTLHVGKKEIVGFSFTSQDGNSLLSSIVAAERFLYPDTYQEKIKCLDTLVFKEI